MFPAARLTDPATHDMLAPSGVIAPLPAGPDPQVTLVEALPAAHMMHGVVCSGAISVGLAHPPAPAPVPIVKGSPTVFINHMPAARWVLSGDVTGCTAQLGLTAMVATRKTLVGDVSAPGANGVSVPPLPIEMVLVNGQWVMKIGQSIYAFPDANDKTFQGKVAEAYQRLNELSPNMRSAFSAIDASGNYVTVSRYSNPSDPFNATATPHATGAGATGVNTDVRWDPNVNSLGGPPGGNPALEPGADVILAHETIHATHNATGTAGGGPVNGDGVNVSEERNTVGLPAQTYNYPGNPADPLNGTALPATNGNPYTENGVRNDYANAGVNAPGHDTPAPQRTGYYTPNGQPF